MTKLSLLLVAAVLFAAVGFATIFFVTSRDTRDTFYYPREGAAIADFIRLDCVTNSDGTPSSENARLASEYYGREVIAHRAQIPRINAEDQSASEVMAAVNTVAQSSQRFRERIALEINQNFGCQIGYVLEIPD